MPPEVLPPRRANARELTPGRPELGLVPAGQAWPALMRRTVNVLAQGGGHHDRQRSDRITAARAGAGLSRQQEPDTSPRAQDPGYLTVSGQAAGQDGSVAPIIGGLPAAEGSAWDTGAPLDDRGADLADEQGSPPDQASHQDTGQQLKRSGRRPRLRR